MLMIHLDYHLQPLENVSHVQNTITVQHRQHLDTAILVPLALTVQLAQLTQNFALQESIVNQRLLRIKL